MNAVLIVIALVTLGAAAVAMTLRNLIHSALLLIASWAGVRPSAPNQSASSR